MNIVEGTILSFDEAVFIGRYPKVKFSHTATHVVKVLKESYGNKRGQHSFTLEVIESTDKHVGETFRKMGRNIYPTATIVSQPDNIDKMAEEKKSKAKEAKYGKYMNWYLEAKMEGKEFKLDKIPKDILTELEEQFN